MPVIPNTLTGAPPDFNSGHHALAEISLDLSWRMVLENVTPADMEAIFDILRHRRAVMQGGRDRGEPRAEFGNAGKIKKKGA